MPYIPQDLINGTFYLYRTMEDAEAGKNPAGSGFVIRYDGPPGRPGGKGTQHYAVTNWHVACDAGASIIRLNTVDGGTDIIEFGPEEWCFDPGKHDIAITPITIDEKIHSVSAVSTKMLYNPRPDWGKDHNVGVGDDVFMIGLFVDHGGFTTNIPSARFGNISMLPDKRAKIKQPTGFRGESFIVDMHSRSGFSGSPVYVYRTMGSDLNSSFFGQEVKVSRIKLSSGDRASGHVHFKPTLFSLLGIHWGQFPERWELKERQKFSEAGNNLVTDGSYVEGMSGMTCVIPALAIWGVLELPELKGPREMADRARAAELAAKPETEPGITFSASKPSPGA